MMSSLTNRQQTVDCSPSSHRFLKPRTYRPTPPPPTARHTDPQKRMNALRETRRRLGRCFGGARTSSARCFIRFLRLSRSEERLLPAWSQQIRSPALTQTAESHSDSIRPSTRASDRRRARGRARLLQFKSECGSTVPECFPCDLDGLSDCGAGACGRLRQQGPSNASANICAGILGTSHAVPM